MTAGNLWSSPIVLNNGTDDTRIRSGSGAFYITRGIDGLAADAQLTIDGAGDTSITGVAQIGNNVAQVTKLGSSTISWPTVSNWSLIHSGNFTLHGILTTSLLSQSPIFAAVGVNYGAMLDLGSYNVGISGSALLMKGKITDGTLTVGGNAVLNTDPGTQLDASLVYESSKVSTIAGDMGDGPSPTTLTIGCPGNATYIWNSGTGGAAGFATYTSNALILSGDVAYSGLTTIESGTFVPLGVHSFPPGGILFDAATGSSDNSSLPVAAVQPPATVRGGVIDIVVPMGQTVTVTGDPELALRPGR